MPEPELLTHTRMHDLWYEALSQEFGMEVVFLDPTQIKSFTNRLYEVRRDLNDESLQDLRICNPPTGNSIYIVKKELEGIEL